MKKWNLFNHRIMNEMDDSGAGGGGEIDFSSDDADYGDDDSNDSIDTPYEDTFKGLGLDPSKYGIGEKTANETEEAQPSQGSEEVKDAGPVADEKSFLDRLNSMGLVHNESPLQVETLDEVKNLIQMGKDYTLKTQSLSEERKAWGEEKTASETELNGAINSFNEQYKQVETQLQEMQQFRFALDQLKEQAPDVFEEVQRAYEGVARQFKNPILDQQLGALNKRLSEAESQLKTRENKLIVDEFEREKGSMTATEQSLKELGVAIDWNTVKAQWAQTGLPLKQVVGSIYFESVAKAQASKTKVEATRAKVQAKPTGAAGSSRPGAKVPQIDRKKSYLDQARELYKTMK